MAKYKLFGRKTKNALQTGFTLIELLVIISIIGLLSAIVLASLRLARNKGNDAKVKAQLRGFRSAAELYFYDDTNPLQNSYGIPVHGTEVADSANSIGPGCDTGIFASDKIRRFTLPTNYPSYVSNAGMCTVTTYPASYTVTAKLSDGRFWCVDGRGNATIIAALPGGDAADCFGTKGSNIGPNDGNPPADPGGS